MKLKNKKTGEICPAEAREDGIYLYNETTEQWYKYELPLLAEYWEYYEEPKEYWFINSVGGIIRPTDTNDWEPEDADFHKELGNYFETREEAEKAVEKLRALKRLKDKGFKFISERSHVEQTKETGESMMFIACTMNDYHDFVFGDNTDIKLLFGGEE